MKWINLTPAGRWLKVIGVAAATLLAVWGAVVDHWPVFWFGFMVIVLANTEFVFERSPRGGTIPDGPGVAPADSVAVVLSKGVEPVPVPGEGEYVAEPHLLGTQPRDCGICASMTPRKGDA